MRSAALQKGISISTGIFVVNREPQMARCFHYFDVYAFQLQGISARRALRDSMPCIVAKLPGAYLGNYLFAMELWRKADSRVLDRSE